MTDTQLTAVEPTTGEFGKSRTRKEDARLITGRTRWTDNHTLPGLQGALGGQADLQLP